MSDIIYYGTSYCRCCCEEEMPHTNARCSDGNWRCGGCNCTHRVPDEFKVPSLDGTVTIRVYHSGKQTLASMQSFSSIAEVLGAAGDSPYTLDSKSKTVYVEVPTAGIEARMDLLNKR